MGLQLELFMDFLGEAKDLQERKSERFASIKRLKSYSMLPPLSFRREREIGEYEQLPLILGLPDEETVVKYDWTDDDIEKLWKGILMGALKALDDGRNSLRRKQETIDWIMSDDIAPFSFVVCCYSEGLIPERVREGVNAMLYKQKQLH